MIGAGALGPLAALSSRKTPGARPARDAARTGAYPAHHRQPDATPLWRVGQSERRAVANRPDRRVRRSNRPQERNRVIGFGAHGNALAPSSDGIPTALGPPDMAQSDAGPLVVRVGPTRAFLANLCLPNASFAICGMACRQEDRQLPIDLIGGSGGPALNMSAPNIGIALSGNAPAIALSSNCAQTAPCSGAAAGASAVLLVVQMRQTSDARANRSQPQVRSVFYTKGTSRDAGPLPIALTGGPDDLVDKWGAAA